MHRIIIIYNAPFEEKPNRCSVLTYSSVFTVLLTVLLHCIVF